jgi:hypothetical protein
MTKRPQIPVSGQNSSQLQAATALALLKSLDAPVAPVEIMIEESVAGRYP